MTGANNVLSCYPNTSTGNNVYCTLGSATNVHYEWRWPTYSNYETATVNWDFASLYNAGYYALQAKFNVYANATVTGSIVTAWYGDYVVNETEEQRAARIAENQKWKQAHEAAVSRAEELLLACLTDEQRESYLKDGYIDTSIKDKTYRLEKVGGVFLLEKEVKKASFCIHPTDFRLPRQDIMLAQLLMLNTDEEKFLKTANKTTLYHP